MFKQSLYSNYQLKETFLSIIEAEVIDELNANITDFPIINYSGSNDYDQETGEKKDTIFWSFSIRFDTPDFPGQNFVIGGFTLEEFVEKAIEILRNYVDAMECSHYEIVRKSYNGREFPNGDAFCQQCGIETKKDKDNYYFSPLNNGLRVLKEGMGSLEYVTQYQWPEETGLQFGTHGIVFGKEKAYTTAFFEAFPRISGHIIFIRGEGKNPDEAETVCWKKYQKYMNCNEHSFTRMYRGKHRTDGFGVCIHCDMPDSEALPPETSCVVCNEPTSNKFGEEYMCLIHENEKSFEEHFQKEIDSNHRHLFKDESVNNSEVRFETLVEYSARSKMKEWIGNDHSKQDTVHRMAFHFERLFESRALGLKPFDNKKTTFEFPDENDSEFSECLDHFLENLPKALELANNKESVPGTIFLPERFLNDNDN